MPSQATVSAHECAASCLRDGDSAAREMAARVHEEIARRSGSDRERRRAPRRVRRMRDA